jgi:hypothetical protein
MATTITLIQPKEVINAGQFKAAPLNARFDQSVIAPYVAFAEDRFLKPFVCAAFYDDLIAEKNATPSNYNIALGAIVQAFPNNSDYEFLWKEYLLPYLSMAVAFQSLPFIAVQAGSNGMFENNTTFGQNIGYQGTKYYMDLMLKTIEDRQVKIKEYLCDNKSLFPLFCYEDVCESCKEDNDFEGSSLGLIIY